MAILSNDVLQAVKNRLPFFNPQVAGPSVQLDLLAQVIRTVSMEVQGANAGFLTTEATVVGPFTVNTAVEVLNPGGVFSLLRVLAADAAGYEVEVRVVPSGYRTVTLINELAAYKKGDNALVPIGEQAYWDTVASLKVFYTPLPSMTVVGTTLILPDVCYDALVAGLALLVTDRHILAGQITPDLVDATRATVKTNYNDALTLLLDRARGRGYATVRSDVTVI